MRCLRLFEDVLRVVSSVALRVVLSVVLRLFEVVLRLFEVVLMDVFEVV